MKTTTQTPKPNTETLASQLAKVGTTIMSEQPGIISGIGRNKYTGELFITLRGDHNGDAYYFHEALTNGIWKAFVNATELSIDIMAIECTDEITTAPQTKYVVESFKSY